jgi:hypothetical protein
MATVGYMGSFTGPPLIGWVAEMLTLRGALGLLILAGFIMLVVGGRVQAGGVAPDVRNAG